MMQKMQSKLQNLLFFLIISSFSGFAQDTKDKSWHYLSIGVHPQYISKPNDRILIFPVHYEYLPKFFKHQYSIGFSANYNNVKINYQKEISVGIRNTFYVLKNPKIRPYFGFGVYNSNLKVLNEWSWERYRGGRWNVRVFGGLRVKVSKKFMLFTEYGNYRVGSPTFNLGLGTTYIFR